MRFDRGTMGVEEVSSRLDLRKTRGLTEAELSVLSANSEPVVRVVTLDSLDHTEAVATNTRANISMAIALDFNLVANHESVLIVLAKIKDNPDGGGIIFNNILNIAENGEFIGTHVTYPPFLMY